MMPIINGEFRLTKDQSVRYNFGHRAAQTGDFPKFQCCVRELGPGGNLGMAYDRLETPREVSPRAVGICWRRAAPQSRRAGLV